MKYITTKCRHCGYATRSHESGVPAVQIGQPIIKCPVCGNLIFDSIATEYEFMTDNEREKFSSENAEGKAIAANLFFIILGAIMLIAFCASGESGGIFTGLFAGGLSIAMGIIQIKRNSNMVNEKIIEQAVYESLKRTENKEYVEFLKNAYSDNKIKRAYSLYQNRKDFMEKYKYFEERDSYSEQMKKFAAILPLISKEEVTESKNFTLNTH